jgi:hypothetical protein
MHHGFERRTDRLNEQEFAETARVLKELAGQGGHEVDPVLEQLVRKGLGAALASMDNETPQDLLEADFKRLRATLHR